MAETKEDVWIVNPGGVVMGVTHDTWNGIPGATKPLSEKQGFRLATAEEIAAFKAEWAGSSPAAKKPAKPKKDE